MTIIDMREGGRRVYLCMWDSSWGKLESGRGKFNQNKGHIISGVRR
jgi:hypothetical protein